MATRPPELGRGKRSLLQEVPSPTSGGQARLDPDRSAKDIRLGAGRYSRESSRVVDSAPPRGRPGGSSPAAAPALPALDSQVLDSEQGGMWRRLRPRDMDSSASLTGEEQEVQEAAVQPERGLSGEFRRWEGH
ncbi:uncharacterized protein [Lolium perenne]|uniref:uncharacterized protein n=1 Tax=Lolium perenne TaxID=4522 RepID=UPI0021EA04F7|nr:uncharacterized protein LOC127323819 [Lolium perenne]